MQTPARAQQADPLSCGSAHQQGLELRAFQVNLLQHRADLRETEPAALPRVAVLPVLAEQRDVRAVNQAGVRAVALQERLRRRRQPCDFYCGLGIWGP